MFSATYLPLPVEAWLRPTGVEPWLEHALLPLGVKNFFVDR